MPDSFQVVPGGQLLIADGFGPVLRWDGLAPEAVLAGIVPPATAPTLSNSGSGSITGTYYGFIRYVDDLGNVSNLSPISTALVVTGAGAITYANVTSPGDSKIRRLQLLRNTTGQAKTFYVDIDTDNLSAGSYTSTSSDTVLATGLAVPLLDVDGNLLANVHDAPPSHKAVMAHHLGRVFYAVEVEYRQGSAKVVFGALTVQGVGTEWTSAVVGRVFYVNGAVHSYTISAIDVPNQILTLASPGYLDATDNFAVYAIRPQPGERKLVYYSEAGQPESVPPVNALAIQEDGDELTGLMSLVSFLYILEGRHVYRFTFQTDPATDGFVFLSATRGCINNRSWVVVDTTAYMLDEQGIHAFAYGQSKPISTTVQELFRQSDAPLRLNWAASYWFHAAHFPQQETIRWYVAMTGSDLPRHAIAYNYRQDRWWLEDAAVPIGASCTGQLAGQPQVFLGTDARRVLALWQGFLDGPDPAAGTCRGAVTSATLDSITDTLASLPSAHVVSNPVAIVSGRGAGQLRIVRKVVGQTVYTIQPWTTLPDSTSVYQLGAIQWRYQMGWFRWDPAPENVERRMSVVFQVCVNPATMTVRMLVDFSATGEVWQETVTTADKDGVSVNAGDDFVTVDLTRKTGYAQLRLPGHRDVFIDGPRFISFQYAGVANRDVQKIFYIEVDGAGGRGVI